MPDELREKHTSRATGADITAGMPAFPGEYPQAADVSGAREYPSRQDY